MEKYNYKIVENKVASIIQNIGLTIFLSSIVILGICLIFSLFINKDFSIYGLTIFFLSLPICAIVLIFASFFSTKEKHTKIFLNEIRDKVKNCKTIQDLYQVYDELYIEAIDKNNMIRISFPLSVKKIFQEINYKIEILKSIKNEN